MKKKHRLIYASVLIISFLSFRFIRINSIQLLIRQLAEKGRQAWLNKSKSGNI